MSYNPSKRELLQDTVEHIDIKAHNVVPLVEAELNRRYPDRARMRPANADGFREAWAIIERLWPQTVERARTLPPDLLHERVDGEWSSYRSGVYGVCLRQVTPETIVLKEWLVAAIDVDLQAPAPDSAGWRRF